MAEPILFADAEAVLATWLRAELADHGAAVPVGVKVPDPKPQRFVRLIRTGGVRHTLVTDAARITVESWATQQDAAADLALLCRALMGAAPGRVTDTQVYRVVEAAGPAYSPDPASATPRYVQTFEVHLRGASA